MNLTNPRLFLGLIFLLFKCFLQPAWGQDGPAFLERSREIFRANPDSGIHYAVLGLQTKSGQEDDSLRMELYLALADAYRIRGDLEGYEQNLLAGAELNKMVNGANARLRIHNLFGLLHWRLANFDSATYYFLSVRDQALQLKDTIGIIKSYNNLGIIYSDVGKDEESILEFLLGIHYANLVKDSTGLNYLYNGLSNQYRKKKDYQKAITYIDKSIDISRGLNNYVDIQRGLSNKGATYFQMEEYNKAEEALLSSMQIAEELNIIESLFKVYYHIAEVYIATGRHELAEMYGQCVLAMAESYQVIEEIKYGHEILYRNAKAMGHHKKALELHEQYVEIKDSIFSAEHLANISEIETRYKTAQKDLQLHKLASDIELLDRNKRLTRTRIIFISTGLALFIIAYMLQQSRNKMLLEKKQRELYTSGILNSREEERKELSRDLHDHVGQNLVLLNQSLLKGDVEKSKELTHEVLSDIRRVSRELYPWQIEKLGLEEALKDLINKTEKMTDILLTFEIDKLDEFVDREKSIQIYRILQECLNNLVKHSNAKSARITLHKLNDHIHLTVQDNGMGFDQKVELSSPKSIGLMTLKDRTQALNGRLEIESASGKGSRFSFSFPSA